MNYTDDKRIFFLDFLRAVATIAVIAMHITINDAFSSTVRYMLASWCVPVFLMITGTLFLNADSCTFQRVWKHVKKTMLIIVFWGFVYNIISLFLIEGPSLSIILKTLKMIVLADTTYCYQFWYLYALIPMYFLLPVFHTYVKNSSNKDFVIVLALFFVFTILVPNIVKYTGDFGASNLIEKFSLFHSLYFYMLLGAFLKRIKITKSCFYVLLVVSSLIFLFVIVCEILKFNIYPEKLYEYDSIYTCLIASVIYLSVKEKSFSEMVQKVFGVISKNSLGIYIVHVIIIQMLRKIVHIDLTFLPFYISLPFVILLVLTMSLVVSIFLKKIPILKNIL